MCLLMFACLLVYLFICLFIIWKWHYKLLKNMPLVIQINFHIMHWFKLLQFFLSSEGETGRIAVTQVTGHPFLS